MSSAITSASAIACRFFKRELKLSKLAQGVHDIKLFILGLPSLPITTAASDFWKGENATLFCNASKLDYHQRNLYHWKWEFKGKELKENGSYSIVYRMDPPNSCAQAEGWTFLHIDNVSNGDLGQYKCAILKSNMILGEDDVVLTETSTKIYLILFIFNCGLVVYLFALL